MTAENVTRAQATNHTALVSVRHRMFTEISELQTRIGTLKGAARKQEIEKLQKLQGEYRQLKFQYETMRKEYHHNRVLDDTSLIGIAKQLMKCLKRAHTYYDIPWTEEERSISDALDTWWDADSGLSRGLLTTETLADHIAALDDYYKDRLERQAETHREEIETLQEEHATALHQSLTQDEMRGAVLQRLQEKYDALQRDYQYLVHTKAKRAEKEPAPVDEVKAAELQRLRSTAQQFKKMLGRLWSQRTLESSSQRRALGIVYRIELDADLCEEVRKMVEK